MSTSRSRSPPHRSPSRERSGSRTHRRHRKILETSRSRGVGLHERSRSRSRSRSPRSRRFRSRSPGSYRKSSQSGPPGKVLGVFGLHPRTRESDLRAEFSRYGHLSEINLITDHRTGQSKCFAFIYYEDVEHAIKARESLNGVNLQGRNIRIDFSWTRKPHSPTPGQYMGKIFSRGPRYHRYHPYDFYRRTPPRDYGRLYDTYLRDGYDRYYDRCYERYFDRYDYEDHYYRRH
eukprot:TRINITY_DN2465_c0_g1_i1.p1 TRINITY_DN2465_c0_g1~~TRINITY_DN2465_c0_g1_i1.p1  ORF type:complete len:233 (+),score=2.99 TRINITY_DN2465_c0_g1_i1:87-785(+)